jgi:hypothetical protein
MVRSFGVVAVVVLTSSCGFIGGRSARCDLRPQTPQCTDWRNNLQPVWTVQEAVCATLGSTGQGGTFSANSTCPTTDMLGGCQARSAEGSLQTNWYYVSTRYKTKDDARAECESNMSFVDPS